MAHRGLTVSYELTVTILLVARSRSRTTFPVIVCKCEQSVSLWPAYGQSR